MARAICSQNAARGLPAGIAAACCTARANVPGATRSAAAASSSSSPATRRSRTATRAPCPSAASPTNDGGQCPESLGVRSCGAATSRPQNSVPACACDPRAQAFRNARIAAAKASSPREASPQASSANTAARRSRPRRKAASSADWCGVRLGICSVIGGRSCAGMIAAGLSLNALDMLAKPAPQGRARLPATTVVHSSTSGSST